MCLPVTYSRIEKPRIRLIPHCFAGSPRWRCSLPGEKDEYIGVTPAEAYKAWLRARWVL